MPTGKGLQPIPEATIYLSSVSPNDKVWEKHRANADAIKNLYRGTIYDCYASRISGCSNLLGFKFVVDAATGVVKFKLSDCTFCRVRFCPMCTWRRQLTWRARFFTALPQILLQYPKARFLFLTLTVRDCPVEELRKTLAWMNKSWVRLTQRKQFPALGWLKSVEVTRDAIGYAHPHFHAILMVNPSYFGLNYLSHEKWVGLWRDSLRVDYNPNVDIRAIKSSASDTDEFSRGFCEVLKYSLKPEDLLVSQDWLLELTTQLHKSRAVAVGGVFRKYISDTEPTEEIGTDDKNETGQRVWFGWREMAQHYSQLDIVS